LVVLGVGATVVAKQDARRCAAAKDAATAKSASARLACLRSALLQGGAVSEGCEAKAIAKFISKMERIEQKGGCGASGSSEALGGLVDLFVSGVEEELTQGLATTTTTVSSSTTTTTAPAACYVGITSAVSSSWSFNGSTGLAAGDAQCDGTVAAGSHVCVYSELVTAGSRGELAGVGDATSFWLQRDVTVDVNGFPSPPGLGGNCIDWSFLGNHIADGEYVTFSGGTPTYHLDYDTTYDGSDTSHTIPSDLECAGVTRSIPCCQAGCVS
jgi:hypothetical protein